MALRPQQPPLYKLYIGGMWTGYGHDDVREWLWQTTHTTPVSIRIWQRGAEATMQSCFVGFSSANVAQDALAILQHRPSMWGQRITVTWARDNPGPSPGEAVPAPSAAVPSIPPGPAAPAVPVPVSSISKPTTADVGVQAVSSTSNPITADVGVQAGGSFLNFVDKDVDARVSIHVQRKLPIFWFHFQQQKYQSFFFFLSMHASIATLKKLGTTLYKSK